MNSLVPQAKGDILVFSDANTTFEPDVLKKLVRYFSNDRIGCVCGKLVLKRAENSCGGEIEGVYWKYENFLKQIEGKMGLLLGANGGIYSLRKELFTRFPADTIVEDFVIPIAILQKGFKVVFEPEAVAYEDASKSIEEEVVRKKRIGAGDYQALFLTLPLLDIRNGLAS